MTDEQMVASLCSILTGQPLEGMAAGPYALYKRLLKSLAAQRKVVLAARRLANVEAAATLSARADFAEVDAAKIRLFAEVRAWEDEHGG